MYYYCKAHLVVNVVFTLMLCIVQLRYQSLSRPGLENIASNRLNEDGDDTIAGEPQVCIIHYEHHCAPADIYDS